MDSTETKKKKEKLEKKTTRARSKTKKAAQFTRIMDEGVKLFVAKGSSGFSMRGLAETLGMHPNNLYNYVDSKRELWIAIRGRYFEEYKFEVRKMIRAHTGTHVELLIKLGEFFLDYHIEDFVRFNLMHLSTPPESNKVGKYEREYAPYNFLTGTLRLVENAINAGELTGIDSPTLTLNLWSMMYGAAKVQHDIQSLEERNSLFGDKIPVVIEADQFRSLNTSLGQYRETFLVQISGLFQTYSKK